MLTMPLSLAHPLAIVPFARIKPLVFSGLIIGAIAPDFGHTGRIHELYNFGHSLPGLLVFCLPCGLAALWLWHRILKIPLIELLPDAHHQRLHPLCNQSFTFAPIARFAWITLSILLGAFTHIAWDSVTHAYGWVVERVPILQSTVMNTPLGELKMYKILQHGSTLAGLSTLFILYILWYRRTVPVTQRATRPLTITQRRRTLSILLVSCTLISVSVVLLNDPLNGFPAFCHALVTTAIFSTSLLAGALILYSLWFHRQHTQ